MPTMDDVLRAKTFKGDVDETEKRVYYTLSDNKELSPHRTMKLLSLLVARMQLSEKELDELLLEVTG